MKFLKLYGTTRTCELKDALGEKCPYFELFWSIFSRIRSEDREILRVSPYLVRMRKSMDQNKSEYEHFLRSDVYT